MTESIRNTESGQSFDFHYKKSPTGELSGKSMKQQTEDAINDIGLYAKQAYDTAVSSDHKSDQAVETANTALQNSNNAYAEALSAKEQVGTLSTTVNKWDAQIRDAVAQSQSAVQTAGEANTKSNTAVSTANNALSQAQSAVQTAQDAVVDTSAAEARINADAAQVAQDKTSAQSSASAAATSAGTAASQAELAERWATWMGDPEDPSEPVTVDGTEYSSKYYAQQAKSAVNDVNNTAVRTVEQNLSEAQQDQALDNLGVFEALEQLITENGGTVPTSLSTQAATLSVKSGKTADEWAIYED